MGVGLTVTHSNTGNTTTIKVPMLVKAKLRAETRSSGLFKFSEGSASRLETEIRGA